MSECWYCDLSEYHPRCDSPGCTNKTHGDGPSGKRVGTYCGECGGVEA